MKPGGIETIDRDRATALPRSNGELVFEAPWHSRAFGLVVALHERGALDFEEFRADLIAEVRAWQGAYDHTDPRWAYYERWQAALERVLARRGLLSTTELDARAATLAHDWSHTHDH
jgi:nitrile hydratase accessory protein